MTIDKQAVCLLGLRPLTKKERQAKQSVELEKRQKMRAVEQQEACRAREEAREIRASALWRCLALGVRRRDVNSAFAVFRHDRLSALSRCDQGDIVTRRRFRNPKAHCEVLHVKHSILTIRNLHTRQRETAPITSLVLVRRVRFAVNVFSVDDSCDKIISNLHADMPLKELVDAIRHEFGLEERQRIKIMFGVQDLLESSLCTLLGNHGLGLRDGAQLAFTVLNKPFALDVVRLSGEVFCNISAYDFTCLSEILEHVNDAFPENLERGWTLQLVSGAQVFDGGRGHQSLSKLAITAESSPLLCLKVKTNLDCPSCEESRYCMRGVMTAATHEGWGRKWNTCYYDCLRCRQTVLPGFYANACIACKGFWHLDCY